MNTYYLRSTQSDWPELLNLGVLLGEIQLDEEGNPFGQGFVVVNHNGYVYEPTGQTVTDPETGQDMPVMAPVLDPDGNPYMHANLRTAQDLSESLSKYFLLDEEGNPRAPNSPAWVFA